MDILIVPYMAITAGWAGGSLYGHQWFGRFTFIPEVLFSLGFGYALYPIIGVYALIAIIWPYAWMQSGPGPALQWGTDPGGMGKPRTLTPLIDWLSGRLGLERGGVNYCRLYMAVKGFLIGLPVGGIPLALGWPLAYDIGFRAGNTHVIKEALSGAFAGFSIWLFIHFDVYNRFAALIG